MKELGLLDCEDRQSIEENFKRISKGGGDLLETVTMEVPLEITWDGNAEGKETLGISDNTVYCVKISDAVLTKNELLGSEIIITKKDGTTENVVVTERIMNYG